MKKPLLPSIALAVCLFAQKADAAVGYINEVFSPGYNFLCNQLDGSPDNTANTLLSHMFPDAPVGTALTEWDPGTGHYLPYSFFDGTSWSINYNLALGQGAVLFTTGYFTNTFLGGVSFAAPSARPGGLYLVGDITPIGGAGFSDVVGRAPADGESVSQFDGLSQSFKTEIFSAGSGGWVDPGLNPVAAPSLSVMEAAFFGLGSAGGKTPPMPQVVPEPGIATLLLVCATLFKIRFSHRKA